MKENIAEVWYNKILDSDNPAFDLCRFYAELSRKQANSDLKESLGGLVVLYGRRRVFQGLLDYFSHYGTSLSGTAREKNTIKTIIQNSFKDSISASVKPRNLDSLVEELQKKMLESK